MILSEHLDLSGSSAFCLSPWSYTSVGSICEAVATEEYLECDYTAAANNADIYHNDALPMRRERW